MHASIPTIVRSTWTRGNIRVTSEVALVAARIHGAARFDVSVTAGARTVRVRGLSQDRARSWEHRLVLDALDVLETADR